MGQEVLKLLLAAQLIYQKGTLKALLEPNHSQTEWFVLFCLSLKSIEYCPQFFQQHQWLFTKRFLPPFPFWYQEAPLSVQRVAWSSPWAMGMSGEEDFPLKLQILVRLSGWETHVPLSGHRAQRTGTSEAAFSVLTFLLMLTGFGEIKCKFVSKWISLGWGWEGKVQNGLLLGAFALKLKHLCFNT